MLLERLGGRSASKVIGNSDFCDIGYVREMLLQVGCCVVTLARILLCKACCATSSSLSSICGNHVVFLGVHP